MKKLYTLCEVDKQTGKLIPFYVGQTEDPVRREKEHKNSYKTGTEDKYVYIRDSLVKNNIEWKLDVIGEVGLTDDPDDSEYFEVIRLTRLGYSLTNMKHGDKNFWLQECVENVEIRNAQDVKNERNKISVLKEKQKDKRNYDFQHKLISEQIELNKKQLTTYTQSLLLLKQQVYKLICGVNGDHYQTMIRTYKINQSMLPESELVKHYKYGQITSVVEELFVTGENIDTGIEDYLISVRKNEPTNPLFFDPVIMGCLNNITQTSVVWLEIQRLERILQNLKKV